MIIQCDFQLLGLWTFSLYQPFLHLMFMDLLSLPTGRPLWSFTKTRGFLYFKAVLTPSPLYKHCREIKIPCSSTVSLSDSNCMLQSKELAAPVILNHTFSTTPVFVQSWDVLDKWADWGQTSSLNLVLALWPCCDRWCLFLQACGLQGLW